MFDCVVAFLDAHSNAVTATATAFIAVFTAVLVCVAYIQGKMMRRSIVEARRSADAALKTAETIIDAERAYVTMSHDSRPGNPGLKIDPRAGTAAVTIDVRNYGRTPADVTDVFLHLAFGALPAPDSYTLPPGHQQTRAFLVTQTGFNHYAAFTGLDSYDLLAVMEEERKLWLYGYVDYRDSFGTRHRGGYMRRYERFDHMATPDAIGQLPELKNNLVFDPTPRFNYDRRRKRGEGNDWDESD